MDIVRVMMRVQKEFNNETRIMKKEMFGNLLRGNFC